MRVSIISCLFMFTTIFSLHCLEQPKEISGREKVLSLVSGEWIAKSMYAVAQLDIAGHLLDGPKSIQQLAKLTGCNEESLYRLLRMLSSEGVFHEESSRFFSNTASSALLAKDHPQSLRNLTIFYSEEMSQSWNRLADCIKEGKPAFDLSFGQPVFGYFRTHPNSAAHFHLAMQEKSKAVVASCLRSFDFSKYTNVYDIGGGMGHFLSACLNTNSHMHGVLYELPDVIAKVKTSSQLPDRCTLVSGDFFQSIPKGGDAYLLKSILHDWSDQDALRILQKCHEAMGNSSKLLIVEPIMSSSNARDHAKIMDVYMMVITGGRERTALDFNQLLQQAGFALESITPTETEFCILEARKI